MLRNIIKSFARNKLILPYKPSINPLAIHSIPAYQFSDKPPKGFEKFDRKKRDTDPAKKAEKEEKPKEQTIEAEKPKNKQEEPEPESELQKILKKVRSENEKKETQEAKKEEKEEKEPKEEEKIEDDEQNEPKKKKSESLFGFNFEGFGGKDGKGFDFKNIDTKYIWLASLLGLVTIQAVYEYYGDENPISYTDFVKNYLEVDKVRKIIIRRVNDGTSYKTVAVIYTDDHRVHSLVLGNVDHFLENLERIQHERGKTQDRYIPVEFDYRIDTNKLIDRMINFFYLGVTVAFLFFMVKQLRSGLGGLGRGGGGGGGGANDIFGMGKTQVKIYGLDSKIKTRFKDVAGLDEAKLEITEFVDFLKKPKKYKELGAKIPRGALLAGPPGTGKTLLAKAAAGEAGVPFLYISGSDFVEMFVGVGASRVRDLFKKAKEHAPAIIFIDEIDAVGRKRENRIGGNDERDNTLNQLLVEMDGFGTDTNVVVLAATNRKELLDPALTRPGRFDRTIEITLPDIEGRKQIFMVHLKPLKLDPEKTMEDYAKRLATLTPGFSGADIANLCNEAAILAARRNKKYVSTEEFEAASERVLAGLEKKKIVSEEERRVVAIHESGHAVVSWFLEGGHPLLKLTIIPRSKGSLGFAQYLPNESSLETKEELLDRICSVLGGRCSEEFFNGKVTTGAYDDLRKAYDIAHAMITKFGMSEKIGFIGFSEDEYVKKHSDQTAKAIDDEIKKIIDECTERTRRIVREHKTEIEKLANALLEKETLDLQAIINILGERPFAPKSNFKAYLEYKRMHDHDEKKPEDKNEGDDNNEGKNENKKPQEQVA